MGYQFANFKFAFGTKVVSGYPTPVPMRGSCRFKTICLDFYMCLSV